MTVENWYHIHNVTAQHRKYRFQKNAMFPSGRNQSRNNVPNVPNRGR